MKKKTGWRKKWESLTEGWFGYVFYALLGITIAYISNFLLGLALHTDLPVVVVVSSSMSHNYDNPVTGFFVKPDFDAWWSKQSQIYARFNISYSEFRRFPFRDGFEIGDMPVVQGADNYKVGDIVVYSVTGQPAPIIHRIVAVNGDGSYQTKGDHNFGQLYYERHVTKSQIHGRVIFIIPKLGWVKVAVVKILGLY